MRKVTIELNKCEEKCPYYHYDDGHGHLDCESFWGCSHPSHGMVEIFLWEFVNGFPKNCPLKD